LGEVATARDRIAALPVVDVGGVGDVAHYPAGVEPHTALRAAAPAAVPPNSLVSRGRGAAPLYNARLYPVRRMPVSNKTSAAARRAAPARPGPDKKGKAVAKKPVVAKPAAKAAAKPAVGPSASAASSAKAAAVAKAKKPPAKAVPAEKAQVPVGKKLAVKKPVAGKEPAAVKKPAVRKPTAAKKPAAKKSVAAREPAKKPAAKPPLAKKAAPAPSKKEPKKAAPAPREKEPKPPAPKPVPPPKPAPSPFSVGDKVVYPHHGAAVIARKEKLPFQGQRTDYFVLEVATDQLILKVPVHKALDQGVRPVISRVVARRVLATFKLPPEEAGANWSRWYKLLTEKINSGDIFQVAEVVRDLTFAQQTKGISPALKRMLSKARLILASELRFALDVSEEEAMRRLDKSLPRVELPEEF